MRQLGSQALLFAPQLITVSMVGSALGVYSFGLIFVSARTNKRHHHHNKPMFPVHCNHSVHSMQGGLSAPLAFGNTVAPALLADVWCVMIVTRLLAAATE